MTLSSLIAIIKTNWSLLLYVYISCSNKDRDIAKNFEIGIFKKSQIRIPTNFVLFFFTAYNKYKMKQNFNPELTMSNSDDLQL